MTSLGSVESTAQSDELSPGARQWLQEHFKVIERKVVEEALSIAKRDQREVIEPRDISAAAMEYAPGKPFPKEPSFAQESGASTAQPDGISPGARQWLQEHLKVIERKVVEEASSTAKRDQREIIEARDISAAAMEYAPGRPFPNEPGFSQRILASFSGITLISAILVVAFGLIGAMTSQTGYTDIVKLFAGAIVGSTGAGIAAAVTRR